MLVVIEALAPRFSARGCECEMLDDVLTSHKERREDVCTLASDTWHGHYSGIHLFMVVRRYFPFFDIHLSSSMSHPILRSTPQKNDRKPRGQILTMVPQVFGPKADGPQPKPKKPLGYSFLPHDLGSAPIHWVEKEYNVVWSQTHKDVSFHHLVL